jgi:DNA end-binding protein Ku
MARPVAQGVLSFGLVAIPVELHTATRSQSVSFHLLHAKCGSRVRNRSLCPPCNEVVERHQLVRGYEFEKGQYVQFTEAELDTLEAEANSILNFASSFLSNKSIQFFSGTLIISGLIKAAKKPIACWPTRWKKAGAWRSRKW